MNQDTKTDFCGCFFNRKSNKWIKKILDVFVCVCLCFYVCEFSLFLGKYLMIINLCRRIALLNFYVFLCIRIAFGFYWRLAFFIYVIKNVQNKFYGPLFFTLLLLLLFLYGLRLSLKVLCFYGMIAFFYCAIAINSGTQIRRLNLINKCVLLTTKKEGAMALIALKIIYKWII